MSIENIPKIFCGTDYRNLNDNDKAENLILQSMNAGFRGFDTAWMYRSEPYLGTALEKFLQKNKDVKREDFFIQSKPQFNRMGYNITFESFEETLNNLKIDYLDAYLIHHPLRNMENWQDQLIDAWRALEELHSKGKIKNIGFCNFLPHHYDYLISKAKIKPSICQMQLHPQHQQEEMVKICKRDGIEIEAWSPLYEGILCSSPIINEIAKKYSKSSAQIILNWHHTKGIVPITKPCSFEEIESNINSFDFNLEECDIFTLDDMDHGDFTKIHTDNGIGFPVHKEPQSAELVMKIFGIPIMRKVIEENLSTKYYFFNIPIASKSRK